MKYYKFFLLCNAILLVLELIIFYTVNTRYLVMNTDFYLSFIVVQLIFLAAVRNAQRGKTFILTLYAHVLIILPVLFVSTLPGYSYFEGEELISAHIQQADYEIVNLENKTVPVSLGPALFVKDSFYYYKVQSGGEDFYFSVDPFSGQVFNHEADFYN